IEENDENEEPIIVYEAEKFQRNRTNTFMFFKPEGHNHGAVQLDMDMPFLRQAVGMYHNIDIACISETHLCTTDSIKFNGYSIYRNDRTAVRPSGCVAHIFKYYFQIVKTSSNIERYIGGKENMKKYLEQKTIENDGVWGTDVEIFGAAILLKTSIYVYMTATGEWQLFNKDITIKKQVSKTEKCLYIRNLNNVLYDVVINVE
ncbi:Uncharacterized protein FWK35_00017984, partial [Aphis craccivora]